MKTPSLPSLCFMERISWVHCVASSGIAAIPTELLDTIFEFAVAETVIKILPSRNKMPWALLFVCPQWTRIVTRNHKLWKRFCLDLDGTSLSWMLLKLLQRMDVARYITCVMVNNAGRFPIQIDVGWDHFLPAIDIHVEELIMDLFDSSIIPFLFHGPDMLRLKTLSLNFHPSDLEGFNWPDTLYTIATANCLSVFNSMQNLRTLKMCSGTSSVGYALLQCQDIPWHQLLSVHFGFPEINIEMLRECLSRCDSLENLGLCFDDTKASDLPEITILPKLESVKYASIAARSLHELGIPWTLLKHVQLKNLNSADARIQFINLHSVLQHLKNVETLELDLTDREDSVGKLEFQRWCHLPHLKSLHLKTLYPEILSLFKVPVLTELTLAVPGGHTSLITPLSQMIQASLCLITAFHCYDFKAEPWIPFNRPICRPDYLSYRQEHLVRVAKFLAKYMPRVELVLGFTMAPDAKLLLKMAAGLALPRLREIRCSLPSSHMDLLLDVIETRAEGRGRKGRLWKVFVAVDGTISERTKARLDAVVKDSGIKFEKKEYNIPTVEVVFI